jgi:hypothetical protein
MRSIRTSVRERTRHNRPRVRVTKRGRRLNDQERRDWLAGLWRDQPDLAEKVGLGSERKEI